MGIAINPTQRYARVERRGILTMYNVTTTENLAYLAFRHVNGREAFMCPTCETVFTSHLMIQRHLHENGHAGPQRGPAVNILDWPYTLSQIMRALR